MTSLLSRLRARHVLTTLVALGLAGGCASSSSDNGAGPFHAPDAASNQVTTLPFDSGARDAALTGDGGEVNPLCGANFCGGKTPDNANACDDYDGGGPPPRHRPDGGKGMPDASLVARDGGPDARVDAGFAEGGLNRGDAASSDAADAGRQELPIPAPLPSPPDAGPRYACQIGRDNLGKPIHHCVLAGPGRKRDPCSSVSDCAPGFGCVDSAQNDSASGTGTGLCFPYCCEASTACEAGSYCAERPLLDGDTKKTPLQVPVCILGASCGLLDPFPCDGPGCHCPSGTACTIVTPKDGTMGCVKPGMSKVGGRCPCAAGYYCSFASNTCAKVCKTDGIDTRCYPGKCQATAGFPPGFGLCVGAPPSVQ